MAEEIGKNLAAKHRLEAAGKRKGSADRGVLRKIGKAEQKILSCSEGHKNGPTAVICWRCGRSLLNVAGEAPAVPAIPYEAVDGTRQEAKAAVDREIEKALGQPAAPRPVPPPAPKKVESEPAVPKEKSVVAPPQVNEAKNLSSPPAPADPVSAKISSWRAAAENITIQCLEWDLRKSLLYCIEKCCCYSCRNVAEVSDLRTQLSRKMGVDY